MNIQQVLDRAREKSGAHSNRKLAQRISIRSSAMDRIVNGDSLPCDETMIRISALAGISAEEGLLLLNMWRAHGAAATIYRRLYQKLGQQTLPAS